MPILTEPVAEAHAVPRALAKCELDPGESGCHAGGSGKPL